MIEIVYGNNPNTSPINVKIERRDFKSKNCVRIEIFIVEFYFK